MSFIRQLKDEFACAELDIRTFSPLTLAFIGDSVFDLIVRTAVIERGNQAANSLHKKTSALVNASAQARMIEAIQADLTEEELKVYKRGRNAKSASAAKNASIVDYRKATGFEALLGYLFLQDRMNRVLELLKLALRETETEV